MYSKLRYIEDMRPAGWEETFPSSDMLCLKDFQKHENNQKKCARQNKEEEASRGGNPNSCESAAEVDSSPHHVAA